MAHVKFTPVRPRRAYEHLVEEIEGAVRSGALQPGEHLPSERDLQQQFKVSRGTVREALRVLESHGLVQSRPGDPRGPKILPISSTPLVKSLERLASDPEVSFVSLLEFRIVLEEAAAFLAAQQRSEEDLHRLESLVEQLATAAEAADVVAFSAADVAFHEAIATAGGNLLIQVTNKAAHELTHAMIIHTLDSRREITSVLRTWVVLHQELLDAIAAGDGELAAEQLRRAIVDNYAPHLPEQDRLMLLRFAQRAERADSASA